MQSTASLNTLSQQALHRRERLLERLAKESTDCYRLFHGTNEGYPGLTVDRYGPQLLIQSFHQSISSSEIDALIQSAETEFSPTEVVYNDRSAAHSRRSDTEETRAQQHVAQEMAVQYRVRGKHQGQDPLLFLDMRAGRRFILDESHEKSVLNLFAYTCGVGICAAMAGASEVCNIDFASRSLQVGEENALLNHLDNSKIEFIQSDFFTAAKQLAGLPIKQRLKRGEKPRHYEKMDEKQFDLVYLDPPRWAKSHFGTVDLIRDYPSVLKPALLSTKEGGTLVCVNNAAQVSLESWLDIIQRCAAKVGRPIKEWQILEPESDFPSLDGQHPLKIAVLRV